MKAMENKVFLNPAGYIEVTFIGHQTGDTFKDVHEKVLPIIAEVKSQGKPLRGLFDLTQQTGYSLNSDKAALQFLEEINYDRIAMYHVSHAEVTKMIIMAIGKSENTKLFDSREEALAWLMAD
jgi:hypothetical protein